MCGIVGYIGRRRALPILLGGIKNLEYRGYDSAGFAVVSRRGVESRKAVGRVARLEEKIGDPDRFPGTAGIIHSRWSTHGEVTEANAHPHADCRGRIWLAHNGIIENYKELKRALARTGHTFHSETDTEALAHLIEEFTIRTPGLAIEEAVRLALLSVRGTYGLVVLDRESPDKLVAARNFSPLLIGIGRGEYLVASDASAVLKHTKNVIYLDDGEMAVLTPREHTVWDLRRRPREKPLHEIEWTLEQAQKGGYSHFMLKEIFEQPEAIENALRGRLVPKDGHAQLGGLETVHERLAGAERLIIAACGTAYLAGRVGKYMLEACAGIPVEVDVASEFRYRAPVFRKGDVFLAISQSGETADTLAALREAREKGVPTFGIVNVVGSTIARETDAGIYQHAGPEIGVASTKAFTSQVAILALLALSLGRQRDLSLTQGQEFARDLARIPELMRRTLGVDDEVRRIAAACRDFKNFLFLGRKYNLPVALEGALKLKEVSYVHAEGYGAGEMKHGPIAMIDERFPSVCIAPRDSVYEKMVSNIEEIKARRGPVIAIATEGDQEMGAIADHTIFIPKAAEIFVPLLSVIPLQLFAYYFGVEHGHDVDRPRNLAKSVTVE